MNGSHILHAKSIKNGTFGCLNVANYLLSLYVKSQNFCCARKLFDEMPERDVRSWTIVISGFARTSGCFRVVAEIFRAMLIEGVQPNEFTLSSVLRSCSNSSQVRPGKGIHGWILRNGINLDSTLTNSILNVYVKCGYFSYAERLFETGADRDLVAWNILIDGHISIGDVDKSVALFNRLPFRDVASWNTIINGLMRNGHIETALELLYEMVKNGPTLNEITFSTALVLASTLSLLDLGRQIHCRVLVLGIHDEGFIRTCLIDLYAKCSEIDKALLIFNKTSMAYSKSSCPKKMVETVAWSSLVLGYARNNDYDSAMQIFIYLIRERVGVDRYSVALVLSLCSKSGTLPLGQQLHALTHKIGHKLDSRLASSLVDMYSKCGNLEDSWTIFRQTSRPNVVVWSSMILACALHGQGLDAIRLLEEMTRNGTKPNEVTFIVVLKACVHSGLIEQGQEYFNSMKESYRIKPGLEHLACMVDLYGRAGLLDEAKDFIEKHDLSRQSEVVTSFLSSCRIHNNVEMAEWASQKLGPHDDSSHVLVSNMYATRHRFDESARIRSSMRERGRQKPPGQSWVQLRNRVYSFVSGDRSNPRGTEIYAYLEKLIGKLRELGYSTSVVGSVLQDVEEEEGELWLGYHSEKLAIACGVIFAPPETPIRVMKNIRVCADCHSFIKLTSKFLGREIIVRDISRFHHFKNGSCSCGDYW